MKNILLWILQILSALIMAQTLFFKFTAAEESVKLFTELDMEPTGRIGIGVGELIAAVLLLIPRTAWFGACMGIGLMSGAIFFHLTKLGILRDDGGYLFTLACTVFVSCLVILFLRRKEIPIVGDLL